jgi:hypothetical protein
MVAPRLSLVASLAFVTSGCLLAEPPERNPRQTPPILNLALADPPVTRLLVLDGPTVYPFSIPMRSEDVGERVWFALHRNYALGTTQSNRIFGPESIEPSHLNDETRFVVFSGDLPAPEPCYQLTLLVCHDSNFETASGFCEYDVELEDTALATWWVVTEATGEPGFEGCPLPTGGGI